MKIHYFQLQVIDETHTNIPLLMPIQKQQIQPEHKIVTVTHNNDKWTTSQVLPGSDFAPEQFKPVPVPTKKKTV